MCINLAQVSKVWKAKCGFHIFIMFRKSTDTTGKYVAAVLNILLLYYRYGFFLYKLCYFKYHTGLSVSLDLYIAFMYGCIHFAYVYRLTFKYKSTRSTFLLLELCLRLTIRRNERY